MGGSRLRLIAAMLAAGLALATTTGSVASADSTFPISGSIDGLYPGVNTAMPVTVSNPFPHSIVVSSLSAVVLETGGPCPASLLSVAPISATIPLAANSSAVVPVQVVLDASAPNACQNATFEIEFAALAVEATPATAPLAFTGSTVVPLIVVGVALIAAGLLARRRRKVALQ